MNHDRDALSKQLQRHSLLVRVVDQCAVAIWATDLEGEVLISEGGLLEAVGLKPGEVVGMNISSFPGHAQWEAALLKIHAGEEKVSFVSKADEITQDSPSPGERPSSFVHVGGWLETYSPLRSPAGRIVGILATAMSLVGATTAITEALPG